MRNKTALYHVIFWVVLYTLWVVVFGGYSLSISRTMTIEFCYLLFITADYYFIRNVLTPQFLLRKKHAQFVLSSTAVILFSAWLRSLVAQQMNAHIFHPTHSPAFIPLYINSVINIALWVFIISFGGMVADRISNDRQLELLEKEKTKNELNFLKAQINPHALFNSLNTIYGHIDKSNQQARNTLLQFSELLRYQLYDCVADKVSLNKEISYISNYIAFQQLRMNEGCIVEIVIESDGAGMEIAPLLLIVLLENAFKFVSSMNGKIVFRLSVADQNLHAYIHNTTEPRESISNSKGIGITNLQRRLALLYPGKHKFTAAGSDNFYETNLIIDLS